MSDTPMSADRPNCARCQINAKMKGVDGVCCKWLMDNVICGDKHVADCTEFIPLKEEK